MPVHSLDEVVAADRGLDGAGLVEAVAVRPSAQHPGADLVVLGSRPFDEYRRTNMPPETSFRHCLYNVT
jgi:hypothetical protein